MQAIQRGEQCVSDNRSAVGDRKRAASADTDVELVIVPDRPRSANCGRPRRADILTEVAVFIAYLTAIDNVQCAAARTADIKMTEDRQDGPRPVDCGHAGGTGIFTDNGRVITLHLPAASDVERAAAKSADVKTRIGLPLGA